MFGFESHEHRDSKRIDRVCALIANIWGKYPQLRLGQLLVNIDKRFETNPFFIEDDEAEAAMKKVLEVGFGKR